MTTAENGSQKLNINRQEFLNVVWLASLGVFVVSFGGVTYFFAMPRFKEGEFGGVVTVLSSTWMAHTSRALRPGI